MTGLYDRAGVSVQMLGTVTMYAESCTRMDVYRWSGW